MRYDRNTGKLPKLNDYVEIVNSTPEDNGLKGTIHGWHDYDKHVALITLDQPHKDGRSVISYPVVCLKPIYAVTKEQINIFHDVFDAEEHPVLPAVFVKTKKIDNDGFISWTGGNRPVDGETVVAVKVRGGIPRVPVKAKEWPQITWRWRKDDDPMNKWDIIAYKVVNEN